MISQAFLSQSSHDANKSANNEFALEDYDGPAVTPLASRDRGCAAVLPKISASLESVRESDVERFR